MSSSETSEPGREATSPLAAYGTAGGFPVTTAIGFPDLALLRTLGLVFGLVVRSMGMGKGIAAGFRSLAGGEVTQYTRLLEDSRRHALDRMIENARLLGANGIVAMRFDASEIGQSLTEIAAYGTAVVLGPPSVGQ